MPGVGKSTILQKVRDSFQGAMHGIISKELRDQHGTRVGFIAVNQNNTSKLFAHKTDIKSDFIVGDKYYVDINVINNFVVPELENGLTRSNCLIFIDGIGRMQSFSNKFLQTVSSLLDSEANVLATIVYDPEPWSLEFKNNPKVILIEVTHENREFLPEVLTAMLNYSDDLKGLSKNQLGLIYEMTNKYLNNSQYIQLQKLYKNAVTYIVGSKVKKISDSEYEVLGNHDSHKVSMSYLDKFVCDCDLYNGRNKYKDNSGECSHIQAVKLYRLKQ